MKETLLSLKIPGSDGTSVPVPVPSGIPTGISIGTIATSFLQVAMVFGVLLSLFYLLYGGFFWIQASGDKQKWDKARRIIVYSIMGLIIMTLALVIVSVITHAFGVESLIGG